MHPYPRKHLWQAHTTHIPMKGDKKEGTTKTSSHMRPSLGMYCAWAWKWSAMKALAALTTRFKEQSSDSQHLHKCWVDVVACLQCQRLSRVSQLARLAVLVSTGFSWETLPHCIRQTDQGRLQPPTLGLHMHTHTHECMYTCHTHMNKEI